MPLPTTTAKETYSDIAPVLKPFRHGVRPVHFDEDTVPHAHCWEPKVCDCECRVCLETWALAGSRRRMQLVAIVLFLLANPKAYEGFPADSMRTAKAVRHLYSKSVSLGDICISLYTKVPAVRALRARGVR